MPASLEEVLQLLRYELTWLEQSGYSSPHGGQFPFQQQPSPFLANRSCLNYQDPLRRHSCRECALAMFVPLEHLTEDTPCHFISVGNETVGSLLAKGDRLQLAAALKHWLKETIARLDAVLESQIGETKDLPEFSAPTVPQSASK